MGLFRAGRLFALTVALVIAVPASASGATLYDQFDNQADGPGSNTPSYFYENGTGDEQAADDFTVPAGQAWTVNAAQAPGIDVLNTYQFRTTIFADAGNRPGAPLFQAQSAIPGAGTTYTFPLSGVPQLHPGHYWISIQLMNLIAWNWKNRTVQSGSPAMWQNPDGSDGIPECVTWNLRSVCEPETAAFPDQAFRLLGDAVPFSAPKKKCRKHHKKHKRSADQAKKKKCKKKKKK